MSESVYRTALFPGILAVSRLLPSGAEGDRTLNLSIANAALSQLSYRPELTGTKIKIPADGLEGKGDGRVNVLETSRC